MAAYVAEQRYGFPDSRKLRRRCKAVHLALALRRVYATVDPELSSVLRRMRSSDYDHLVGYLISTPFAQNDMLRETPAALGKWISENPEVMAKLATALRLISVLTRERGWTILLIEEIFVQLKASWDLENALSKSPIQEYARIWAKRGRKEVPVYIDSSLLQGLVL